jgi:hypothetical protein
MIPTGDPNIPPTVHEKDIRELIVEKTEGATGSKEELFSPNDVVGDALEEGFAEEERGGNKNEGVPGGRSVAEACTVFIFASMHFLPCSCII